MPGALRNRGPIGVTWVSALCRWLSIELFVQVRARLAGFEPATRCLEGIPGSALCRPVPAQRTKALLAVVLSTILLRACLRTGLP
jgi:hypothetical protein